MINLFLRWQDLSHSINHIRQESDSFFRVESIWYRISLSFCINLAVLAPVSISLSVFVFYYMYLSGLVPCISTQRAVHISPRIFNGNIQTFVHIWPLLSVVSPLLMVVSRPSLSSHCGTRTLNWRSILAKVTFWSPMRSLSEVQKSSRFPLLHPTVSTSMPLSTLSS